LSENAIAPGPTRSFETPTAWQRLRAYLPAGTEIPERDWRFRHRVILGIIFVHAIGLAAFGWYRGWPAPYYLGEGGLIAGLGLLAAWKMLGRRFRSSVAALALVTSSAVLVQFWGGVIEGHFHYFVVVAIVSLYMDWAPFLLAILYVAVDHGVIGTFAPFAVYNHPDAQGNPWKWAGIHAALVLAECAALMVVWRSNERARAHAELVLRSTGEGLIGVGLDGRITFANPAAEQLTGRKPQNLIGTRAGEMLRGVAFTGGNGRGRSQAEGDVVRPDGTLIPVEVVATPILHSDTLQGSVLAVKDISDRRRSQEEHTRTIEQASEIKRLQELDDFKTLFINTAAHELRTPLTPLKLHLHTLRGGKRGDLNVEQQRIVSILSRNLDRLGQLIEDVLDVGRLQAGRLSIEKESILVNQLVSEVVESFQEVARKGGVSMTCRIDLNLQLEADPKRLTQVLFNLLENALKFTPEGGTVHVEADRQGTTVEIRVRDSGVGIKAEDIAKLFQPFSQVHDPMQRTRGGSGLGLYICKGLIQLHGGTIGCTSGGPGQGTMFTISLPVSSEHKVVQPGAQAA